MTKIPSIVEIRDNFLNDIQTKLYSNEGGIPMLQRSTWVIIALAVAGVLRAGYEYARYQYNQIFTSTADKDSLILKGEQYGIFLAQGNPTILEIKFTGDIGVEIPSNTQVIANNYIYTTNNLGTLDADGQALIEVTATIFGDVTILTIGSEVNLVSPIAQVDNIGLVTTIITRGQSSENIEDYRKRIQFYERNKPQGGSIPDFVTRALEVPLITAAFVDLPTSNNRIVKVYPLTDGSSGTRIPSAEKLAEVLAYMTEDYWKPPCTIEVLPSTELEIEVNITAIIPDTDAMKTIVTEAWEKMLLTIYPLQYTYQTGTDDLISSANFQGEARLVGAKAIELSIYISSTVTIPYKLQIGQILKLGKVTWQ